MNAEAIAKLGKAVVLVASISGYTISPEHIDAIIQGASALFAVIYGFEAWKKSTKPKE